MRCGSSSRPRWQGQPLRAASSAATLSLASRQRKPRKGIWTTLDWMNFTKVK